MQVEVEMESNKHRHAQLGGTADDTDYMENSIEMFEKQQEFMQTSAEATPYTEACDQLGLDKANPKLDVEDSTDVLPTILKPWQVTAIAWLQKLEKSPIGGGILADGCGLGKTLSALSLVYLRSQGPQEEGKVHRPTLVVCLSGLVDTWLSEITKRFGSALHVYVFHRSSVHTTDMIRKQCTINTTDDLIERLNQLDSCDLSNRDHNLIHHLGPADHDD